MAIDISVIQGREETGRQGDPTSVNKYILNGFQALRQQVNPNSSLYLSYKELLMLCGSCFMFCQRKITINRLVKMTSSI